MKRSARSRPDDRSAGRWRLRRLKVGLVLGVAVLAACRDAPRAPPAAEAASPAAPGPVNPDAGVVRYACADGGVITAGYPDSQTAIVTYKDHAYTLKQVGSAGDARYVGYGLQWRTKGSHAELATLKPGEDVATAPGISCTAEASESNAGITKTAYRVGLR